MKKAFTLAEIMICISVMGILAVVMLLNIKPEMFNKKSNIASAYKAIDEFEKASQKMREKETQAVPSGDFMTKVLDEYEYAIINDDGTTKDATQVLQLFSKYMKIENVGEEFCDNTGYCSSGESYAGAKLTSQIHVGLEVLEKIEDCPIPKIPLDPDAILPERGKCWGKLYIDTNGTDKPNEEGEDVFIFGLNEKGVAY